jgi:hypothetical protein
MKYANGWGTYKWTFEGVFVSNKATYGTLTDLYKMFFTNGYSNT